MRKKIAVVLLGAILLLGLAGCTPAAGNGEDTASPDTTTSLTDQAAVEGSAETDSVSEIVSGDSSETAPEETDATDATYEETTYDPAPPPTPIQPETPQEQESDPGQAEEPADTDGWGVERKLDTMGLEEDPNYTPPYTEGGTPEDFITTEYDALNFVSNFQSLGTFSQSANNLWPANIIDAMFPFECVRKTDDTHFYVVYKIRQGGYYYMFFETFPKSLEGEYPSHILTNVSYVYKKLSYADLEDVIKPGMSIAAAEAIDPSFDCFALAHVKGSVFRRMILTDGMLMTAHERTENGDFELTSAVFHTDFKEDFTDHVDGLIHNYRILESDYPA